MNVEVKSLPKNQVELTIELTTDELVTHLEKAAQDISQELNIPGFRPGKAPYDVVEKRVGAQRILQHAAEHAVQWSYPRVVIEKKLTTMGSPSIELQKLAPGNPLVYAATVALLPAITIGDYTKFKTKKNAVSVEAKDIEATLGEIHRMYGTEKRVQRKAQHGDKVEIDLAISRDKVPIDGGSVKNHPVVIGASRFIPGFEEQLIDLAEKEVKEFTLRFPKDYHQKMLADKDATFKVTVKSVFEIELLPLDNAFAKKVANLETLADLRSHIEKNISQEREESERQRFELELLDEVVNRSKFGDIPDLLVKNELDRMIHELKTDIEHRRGKFEDYLSSVKKTEEEIRQGMIEGAERRIKSSLLIREIAKREHITVREDEITAELKKEQELHAGHDHDTSALTNPAYRDYLRTVLINRHVLKLLGKNATSSL